MTKLTLPEMQVELNIREFINVIQPIKISLYFMPLW